MPITQEQLDESVATFQQFVNLLGLSAKSTAAIDQDRIRLRVESEDPGRLIGRKGRTLSSIQTLLNNILRKDSDEFPRVLIDVDDYRQGRGEDDDEGDEDEDDERESRPRPARPERRERDRRPPRQPDRQPAPQAEQPAPPPAPPVQQTAPPPAPPPAAPSVSAPSPVEEPPRVEAVPVAPVEAVPATPPPVPPAPPVAPLQASDDRRARDDRRERPADGGGRGDDRRDRSGERGGERPREDRRERGGDRRDERRGGDRRDDRRGGERRDERRPDSGGDRGGSSVDRLQQMVIDATKEARMWGEEVKLPPLSPDECARVMELLEQSGGACGELGPLENGRQRIIVHPKE